MRKIKLGRILSVALAVFFLAGALGNLLGPDAIIEEYQRWGYPVWFRFVTGTLELTTAWLLIRPRRQIFGVLLGSAEMTAALLTLLIHGEFLHALAPVAVLMLLPLILILKKTS